MTHDATPITIPALERFLKDARPWGLVERHPQGRWGGKAYEAQRTDPDHRNLLADVGLKRRERVLVVAGHRATWALALARAGVEVTYSDVSRELTDHIRKNVRHRNIVDYLCTSYVVHPVLPNQYDWTFTFEAVGPKPFILLTALLNTRGGKYVLWEKGDHSARKLADLSATLKLCRTLYKVTGSSCSEKILCTDRKGRKKPRRHRIITVETTEQARQKMFLDLRLLQFLFKRRKASSEQLVSLMGCSQQDLRRALGRLSRWCGVFKEKYARTLSVNGCGGV